MEGRGAWRLLAGLAGLNVLSFVDRQLVAALAPLLMADLGLNRAQVGLLIGPAFILVFALSTLATATLADRSSRTRLVAACLAVWSAATALTGAAAGFRSLAACRALVGVGESALSPTALAMIADSFPVAQLGLASGVFYAAIPVGFACSLAIAGWLAPWLGWRACFVALGAVGLLAVVLVGRISDPPHPRLAMSSTRERTGAASAFLGLRGALAREPSIALLSLGGAALAYASGASQLGIAWLVQERGFAFQRAAWLSALVIGTAGLAGNVALGMVTDRARRVSRDRRLQVFAALGAVSLLLSAGFYTVPAGSPLFFACWLATQAWMLGWYGPLVAALQELAPPEARASVIGLALMVVNVLGVALGPWITGIIGDHASLTRGLLVSVGVGGLGLLLVLLASRRR